MNDNQFNPNTPNMQTPPNGVNIRYVPSPVNEHVTTGGWFGRILLSYIPIVGIIMLFVWAFGNTQQKSLQTWARAQLIFMLIGTGVLLFMCTVGVSGLYELMLYA